MHLFLFFFCILCFTVTVFFDARVVLGMCRHLLQFGGTLLEGVDLDLDDEAMRGLFARRSEQRPGKRGGKGGGGAGMCLHVRLC